MRRVLLIGIRGYQWLLRPLLPASCRFYPSCSCYAHQAITEHGAWRGSGLAIKRIARCHPWNPGGYDPVPKVDADGQPNGPPASLIDHPN